MVNGDLIRWTGYVPAHGHSWLTRAEDGARFLVRNPEQPSEGRNYELFQAYPALFKNFSALYPDGGRWHPEHLETTRVFADRYGSLMLDMEWGTAEDGISAIGTPVETWQREITRLGFAVRIWTLLDARDEDALADYIRLGDDGIAVATWGKGGNPSYQLTALREIHDAHPFAKGDVLAPAALVLKHVISERLRDSETVGVRGVNLALEWTDTTQQKLAIVVRPDWLHEALWLQFAHAVTGNKQYGQCQHCHEWFEEKTQQHRLYCSDSCKMKAYRERKGETR